MDQRSRQGTVITPSMKSGDMDGKQSPLNQDLLWEEDQEFVPSQVNPTKEKPLYHN